MVSLKKITLYIFCFLASIAYFLIIGCTLVNIEFEQDKIELFKGQTLLLDYQETGLKRFDEVVVFKSDDVNVAVVSSGGRVVGTNVGETLIKAFSSINVEITDSVMIRVTNTMP